MFGDLVSSRLIQSGLVFFVIVVGGSLLYYWHVHRTTIEELGPIPLAVESMENTPSASHPNSEVEMGGTVNEGRDVSTPNTDDAVEPTDTSELLDESLFGRILDETEEATSVAEAAEIVEDDGYPEVPADFPFSVVWKAPEGQQAEIPTELFEELELMSKVMIKLWNEGNKDFAGAFMANGRVYPTYPDVAYVTWVQSEESGEWYINDVSTVHSSVSEQLLNGVFPPGIEIVNQDSAGIDPEVFLLP